MSLFFLVTNKKDMRYTTADIEGSQPRINKMITTRAGKTNPLVPKYQIPNYVEEKPLETKFIRDTLNTNDIEGTHAKTYRKQKQEYKIENQETKKKVFNNGNPLNVKDIEGTSPTKRYVKSKT